MEGYFKYVSQENFNSLGYTIQNIRKDPKRKVFPESKYVLKMFTDLPIEKVKVVFIGGSPYKDNSNIGRAFGINTEEYYETPKIIQDSIKELERCYNTLILDFDYSLQHWIDEGVLLLNTFLTIEYKKSHFYLWKDIISKIIKALNDQNVIYVLFRGKNKHLLDDISKDCKVFQINKIFGSNIFMDINKELNKNITWY